MNVQPKEEKGPPPADVCLLPEMRAALAARDIATAYRILQRHGISQRRIAALTGQAQSEISEIIGGRQVMAVDVLERIADGLGVPRGWLGVAFDASPAGGAGPTLVVYATSVSVQIDSGVHGRTADLDLGRPQADARPAGVQQRVVHKAKADRGHDGDVGGEGAV